jgi:hypothetical protein
MTRLLLVRERIGGVCIVAWMFYLLTSINATGIIVCICCTYILLAFDGLHYVTFVTLVFVVRTLSFFFGAFKQKFSIYGVFLNFEFLHPIKLLIYFSSSYFTLLFKLCVMQSDNEN